MVLAVPGELYPGDLVDVTWTLGDDSVMTRTGGAWLSRRRIGLELGGVVSLQPCHAGI